MRVYCPKCQTGYEVADELLRQKARRLKCGNCGEVFVVDKIEEETSAFDMLQAVMSDNDVDMPKDNDKNDDNPVVTDKEIPDTAATENVDDEQKPETEDNSESQNIDIADIFERLSERTENLINEEKKLPFYKKFWLNVHNLFGLQFRINWKIIFIVALLGGVVWSYNNRYDIVRKLPFTNKMFKALGINAKIAGEGLEFQNVSWELLADGEGTRLDIRGFIFNQTDADIVLPKIHVEILDKETSLLQSQNTSLKDATVRGGEKVPLLLSISNPAPTLKYVYLTFIDIN